jgi:hypothetical protein
MADKKNVQWLLAGGKHNVSCDEKYPTKRRKPKVYIG